MKRNETKQIGLTQSGHMTIENTRNVYYCYDLQSDCTTVKKRNETRNKTPNSNIHKLITAIQKGLYYLCEKQ